MTEARAAAGTTRAGLVAIVGRPNVGKSTWLNAVLGQKLAITTPKPQTTRFRLLGVKTRGSVQAVYIDTPGLQPHPRRRLNKAMNREALRALVGVDVIVLMIAALEWTPADAHAARLAREAGVPVLLAVNKVDRVKDKRALLPFLERVAREIDCAEVVPISARRGTNLDALERCVTRHLKPGPFLFPADALTDRSERFLAAEIVREKLMLRLGAELPYSVSVITDEMVEDEDLTRVSVTIWVEKRSQRGIVIGAGGRVLKDVGMQARRDIELLLGRRVHLTTWVKVKEHWADDPRALAQLGLDA